MKKLNQEAYGQSASSSKTKSPQMMVHMLKRSCWDPPLLQLGVFTRGCGQGVAGDQLPQQVGSSTCGDG